MTETTSGDGAAHTNAAVIAAARTSGPRVIMHSVPAGSDSDTATVRTVRLMSRYINQGRADPLVGAAARSALNVYGRRAQSSAAVRAWCVYWFTRHNIKFVHDEATMFRIGRPGEQDLVVSPSLLLRLRPGDRKGDCDCFTCLECALASHLGLETVIVTVACDPSDRRRWSHVFPMVLFPDGSRASLDATPRARYPGWMVPRDRIYRWQCWAISDGAPVDVGPPGSRRTISATAKGAA
jgi:hypothetical protein